MASNIYSQVLEGQQLLPLAETQGSMIVQSKEGASWRFDPELLSLHVLALGSIGSGKTNLLYHIIKQILNNLHTENDIIIFFDAKGDFLKKFYRQGDYVIGNSQQYSRYNPVKWNLYRELTSTNNVNREDTIREIATSLFSKRINSSKEPAFASGARDIFAALIEAQMRNNERGLNNAELKRMFRGLDVRGIKARINNYPDLNWINIYMHKEDSATTQSFLSPLNSVVNDVFTAHFAEAGNFSMREAVSRRGGKSIFLEYDIMNSNLIDTVYTVLLDIAGKTALGNEDENKHVYFILDEFPLIPKLNYIDGLLNFGRSRGVRVIAGIQNINQIKSLYGDNLGSSILSGFSTYIIFRLFDEESRKLVSERHGKNRRLIMLPYDDVNRSGNQEHEHSSVIEDWDITSLQRGECIISLPYGNPYKFYPASFTERPTIQIQRRYYRAQIN